MNIDYDRRALSESLENSKRSLRALTNRVRSGSGRIYREQGAVFAKNLFEHTPPNNIDGKSGGEGRVIRDTNRIFKPVQSIPFVAFVHAKNWEGVKAYDFKFRKPRYQKSLDKGDYERLPYIFQRTTAIERMKEASNASDFIDTPTKPLHKMGREPLLPYTGKTTGTYYVKGKKRQAQALINRYANLARYAVGKMSGGWRTAVGQLGGSLSGLPFSGKGLGWGAVMREATCYVLEVGNAYGNFNHYADNSSQYAADFQALQSKVHEEVKYLLYKTVNDLKMK